jgi:hypothetical protein
VFLLNIIGNFNTKLNITVETGLAAARVRDVAVANRQQGRLATASACCYQ